MMEVVYVATPYSARPARAKWRADKKAADLILEGHLVYSPISHSHTIADHMRQEHRTDHDLWMPQCLHWLAQCTKMVVVADDKKEVEESVGCQMEIEFCKENGIPIEYDYYD